MIRACATRSDVFSDRCHNIRSSANLSILYHPKLVPEFGWIYKESICAVKYAGNTMCIWIMDFVGRSAHVVTIWRGAILWPARTFQTNSHHHNRSVLSIFYTMRRVTLSRIALHTIITLWVLYCMCIGHLEDHPSSERVSWDNVTEAMHNLAIRKPVTATFSSPVKWAAF